MARSVLGGGVVVLVLHSLACGVRGDGPTGPGTSGETQLPRGVWTWVEVAGSACGDGSPTGIGVMPGDGPDLLVFLDAGGACWDAVTCVTRRAASPGPFAEAELAREPLLRAGSGSILDRTLPGNPFRSSTMLFVPYCTGDLHAGDAVRQYRGARRPFHHKGRPNVAGALAWARAHLPEPSRVIVAGSAAGGYGALFAFDGVKRTWPAARGYLLDDSGAPLVGADLDPEVLAGWREAWALDELLRPICARCDVDLSRLVVALATRYPGDRLALLSWTDDPVARRYAGVGPVSFEAALVRLEREVFAPLPNARTFLVAGAGQSTLRAPGELTVGGVPGLEWLRRMVEDEPGWRSLP